MAYKCTHCDNKAVPVWNEDTKKFDNSVRICKVCFDNEKAEHWEYPFKYKSVFEKKGIRFAENHPEYPKAFLNTDLGYSPMFAKANQWKPLESKSGLILHGETGTGKSRAAWIIFNRLWLEHYPKTSLFLQMRKFEAMIEKGFDERGHGKVLDTLISCPVVVLDDLGKERLTQRLESDLFAIIDERSCNERVTIITTNYTGEKLIERFQNKETGVALVRRLRDYYTALST